MTRVCKPHSLLAVYLLIQGLSYVFFVIFIHLNLEAVNTFVMNIIKLHKLHVKPLKSCYRAIHHLLVLITKALQHLLLLDNTRKRGKQGKIKETTQNEVGKMDKRQKRHCGGAGGRWRKRRETGMTERWDSIQQQASFIKICFLLPHYFSYCNKMRLSSNFK